MDLTRKIKFFEGCSWFKFNNLVVALGIALKFYTSVAIGLEVKCSKFLGLIATFVVVAEEKLVKKPFCSPIIILNSGKSIVR